ncbi:unnamed protein product [Closterium sp. Yama58-4]|nr:unnamed protein product [Closterium sp. Yama58-4]
MERYGLRSGVSRLGLSALVAGLVAISFLATHANAAFAANACARVKCGSKASCTFNRDGTPYCLCNDGTLNFNETDKTCYNACAKKKCGPEAVCKHMAPIPNSPAECICPNGKIYNDKDKKCYATCHKDCGAAHCVVKNGKQQCQCPEGLVFNPAKKTCRAAARRAGGQV